MRRENIKELVEYFLGPMFDRDSAAASKDWLYLLKTAGVTDNEEKNLASPDSCFLDAITDFLSSNGYPSLLKLAYEANRDAKRTTLEPTKERRYQFKHLLLNVLILVFAEQYRIVLNPLDGDDPLVEIFKPTLVIRRDRNVLDLRFYIDLELLVNSERRFEVWFSPAREPLKYHLPISEISVGVRPLVASLLNREATQALT